jgi:hypothetical protein
MWKIIKLIFAVCIAASVSCLFTACGSGGGSSTSGSSTSNGLVTSTTQSQSVQYTLSAKAVSNQGDAVPITFAISNINGNAIYFATPPTFAIYRNTTEVWNSLDSGSAGVSSTTAAFRNSGGCMFINPGELVSNNAVTGETVNGSACIASWGQMDAGGNLVAPGYYTVKVEYSGVIEQVTITIQ